MAYNNNRGGFHLNEEHIASFLKGTVRRVETSSNVEIETLKQIKKLFKKNVPFSRRNYVVALLIRNASSGFRSNRFNRDEKNDKFSRERSDRYSRNDGRDKERTFEGGSRPERIRTTIDPSVAGTVFISVGRSRGVFPRDLVGLLIGAAGLDRTRIGEIRVLSNYSFIQLFAEDCDKVISALDGYEYRGRKLSVSYSHKKEDEDQENPSYEEEKDEKPTVENASYNESENETQYTNEIRSVSSEEDVAPMEDKPYSETTDDGQVKSHFGSGEID